MLQGRCRINHRPVHTQPLNSEMQHVPPGLLACSEALDGPAAVLLRTWPWISWLAKPVRCTQAVPAGKMHCSWPDLLIKLAVSFDRRHRALTDPLLQAAH